MTRYIIFDVMGVIFTVGNDTGELLIPYIRRHRPDMSRETIHALYTDASLGRLSVPDFWASLGFAPEEAAAVQRDYLDTQLTPDLEFPPCAHALREKGYGLALLSNDISPWSAYLRKRHGLDEFIHHAFISSDIGARKPSPEIYRFALDTLNAKPWECVFIDDDPRRVEAAEELGIPAIVFNRTNVPYRGVQVRSFPQLTALL